MRINVSFSLISALLVAGQILALGTFAFEISEPWDSLWHALAYAALALLLSIAADGARPLAVVLAALALAGLDEWLQASLPGRSADVADFAVALFAAAATVTGLALARGSQNGGKASCAESLER
jgi:VanZ family protein